MYLIFLFYIEAEKVILFHTVKTLNTHKTTLLIYLTYGK